MIPVGTSKNGLVVERRRGVAQTQDRTRRKA
jgi:hypothetical protein